MALKVRRITEGKMVKGRFVPNVKTKPRRKPNRKRKAAKKKK